MIKKTTRTRAQGRITFKSKRHINIRIYTLKKQKKNGKRLVLMVGVDDRNGGLGKRLHNSTYAQ